MSQTMFIVIIVILYIAVIYFLVFGRRKKQRKKLDELNSRISIGTRICSISGVIGTVVEMNDRDVIIELSCDPEKSIRARLLRGGIKSICE